MVPLYGFVEGDVLGILVLAHRDMTVREIIERLSDAASPRVDPRGPWRLVARGRAVAPEQTVEALSLDAFERIDLRRAP